MIKNFHRKNAFLRIACRTIWKQLSGFHCERNEAFKFTRMEHFWLQ